MIFNSLGPVVTETHVNLGAQLQQLAHIERPEWIRKRDGEDSEAPAAGCCFRCAAGVKHEETVRSPVRNSTHREP